MSSEDKRISFVSAREEGSISRSLIIWLNGWLNENPDVPLSIQMIDYEFMPADKPCMALSLVQSTYIVEEFIDGSYIAEYQFKIIYRTNPNSPDARLSADELLDNLGQWASGQKPYIGGSLEVREFEQATQAALFARLDGGWEDHQIFFRMTYQVDPER